MKFIAAVLFALVGAFAFAQEKPAVEYYTNAVERAQASAKDGKMHLNPALVDPAQYAMIDDILVSGEKVVRCGAPVHFPKATRRFALSIKDSYPNVCQVYLFKIDGKTDRTILLENTDVWVNSIEGLVEFGWTDRAVVGWKKRILNVAMKSVKKQLRAEGIGFVVKDGHNPVQDRLDALTKALDAPLMVGAKDAFAKCGIKFDVDFSKAFPAKEEMDKLMNDIYLGQIEFTAQSKGKMLVWLGVEGYNQFVEKYNK